MSLADEIAADIYDSDVVEDLMKPVSWRGHTLKALAAVVGVEESFEPGGTQLASIREFKFRRQEILEHEATMPVFGDILIFRGRDYSVSEVDDRQEDWPLVAVTATLMQ